jgi:CRP/FNR family transcriptional regulator, cyclic AMP receptor protein
MENAEKLRLLKSLHLLRQVPETVLSGLTDFLKPVQKDDGAAIFEEGSKGTSLFFVSGGQVRIVKRAAGGPKDLAVLGPGDCFGEMAMIAEMPRSASAIAQGSCMLFELARVDLNAWLKAHPEQAMQFFTDLVQLQSTRLRRTSNELTILYELSNLLVDQGMTGPVFAGQMLERVLPHLEGSWVAAVYFYNEFNGDMERIAARGELDFDAVIAKAGPDAAGAWQDSSTFHVSLMGKKKPVGHLVFHAAAAVDKEERGDIGRTLSTVSRLVASALENIAFRTDEQLRARLKMKTAGSYGSGF